VPRTGSSGSVSASGPGVWRRRWLLLLLLGVLLLLLLLLLGLLLLLKLELLREGGTGRVTVPDASHLADHRTSVHELSAR
jgi:hypothetical protein